MHRDPQGEAGAFFCVMPDATAPAPFERRGDESKGVTTMPETTEKRTILTEDGYKKLEAELDEYKSVRRKEIAEQIATARGFGDLSENAEYDEALNEQSRIEAKIVEMENLLHNCVIMADEDVNTEIVSVGNTVRVKNLTLGREQTFTIVGANETDPKQMKISSDSPIGGGLLGARVGHDVSIETPGGLMTLHILSISR